MSSKIIGLLFFIKITFVFIYRFLFGNLWGMGITILFIYNYSEYFFGVKSLTLDQLMLWMVDQSEEAKIAICSSLITIVGFLIAYATSTANWRSQLRANLKIQAAAECESFFNECSCLLTSCKIYLNSTVDTLNKIQNICQNDEAIFEVMYHREKTMKFIRDRERLSVLSADIYRISSKYFGLFTADPNLGRYMKSAVHALTEISEAMWIRVPYYLDNEKDVVESFLSQVKIEEFLNFIEVIDKNFGEINFSSGAVRGGLINGIIGFNFWSLLYMYKDKKNFFSTLKKIQNI
jgi:hypothetical protein